MPLQKCTSIMIARENGRAHPERPRSPFGQTGAFTRLYRCARRARNSHCMENTQFLYLFCARPEPYSFFVASLRSARDDKFAFPAAV
jgi:hypothetical protein